MHPRRSRPRLPGPACLAVSLALVALGLLPGGSALALSDTEIGRLTMGRATYPAGAWSFVLLQTYAASDLSDPRGDTFSSKLAIYRSATDRLTLGAVFKTQARQRRERMAGDRIGLGARYRIVDRPFQLAPSFFVLPSLRGEAPEVELGFEALRNRGPLGLSFTYEAEAEKEEGEGYEISHEIEPAAFYRFSLHGMIGSALEMKLASGATSLEIAVGGGVSRNVFMAIEPKVGLSDRAADFALHLQFQVYLGPYGLGSWGLQ